MTQRSLESIVAGAIAANLINISWSFEDILEVESGGVKGHINTSYYRPEGNENWLELGGWLEEPEDQDSWEEEEEVLFRVTVERVQ